MMLATMTNIRTLSAQLKPLDKAIAAELKATPP
jgi:hypothetical protein